MLFGSTLTVGLLLEGGMKMRRFFLSCAVIGLVILSACAGSATVVPVPTSTATLLPTLTPTEPSTPLPTATKTPLPLTRLDLWLSIEDDPAAPPIGKLKAGSVAALYIWAKAPEGVEGDFILQATLQNGIPDQLGFAFHASSDGQVIDCGLWEGGFLSTRGTVTIEAYAGSLLLGSFTFSIN